MAELIEIPAGDGTAEAYLSRPPGTPKGGVLLFMDAIGLRPRIGEMADEIASWGYLVLAPNVFYRDGSAAELAPTVDLRDPEARASFFATSNVGQYIANLTPERAAADTAAYVERLQGLLAESGAGGARLGATGYCMGARLATRAGTLGPDSRTSTGAPSLLAYLRVCALRVLTTSRGRTASLGEPETQLGALMLNTSYVVVVRYGM